MPGYQKVTLKIFSENALLDPLLYLIMGILREFCQVEAHKHLNFLRLSISEIKSHGHIVLKVSATLPATYNFSII